MFAKIGLRGRAIILCMLLVLGTGACIVSTMIWRNHKTSVVKHREHIQNHAAGLALAAAPAIFFGDTERLECIVQTIRVHDSIARVRIEDRFGNVLAQFCRDRDTHPEECTTPFPPGVRQPDTRSQVTVRTADQIYVATPVFRPIKDGTTRTGANFQATNGTHESEPIATVFLSAGLGDLYAKTESDIAFCVVLILFVMAATAVVAVLAVRQLLRPVQNLVDTTTLIATGDLSRRASENAVGEIGVLARSFNRMANTLSETMDGLEHQVRDRTIQLARTTEALTEKERYLRTVLASQPQCVKTLDRDGRVLTMNPAGLAILRVDSEDDIRGISILEFICPEHHSAFKDLHRRVFEGGRGILQFEVQPREGCRRWVETNAVPLYDGRHEVAAYLATTRDITEEKKNLDELHSAKERAEAADQAKGDFLANISHEIRTPMNGIIGMTQIVLDSDLTQDQRGNLETVSESAESLLRLLNDLLDFSKIDAGKLKIETTRLNVTRIVESAVGAVAPSAAGRPLSIEHHVSDEIPNDLLGDPHRLGQVLINLIGNAVKFTERGTVTISATAERTAQTSATVLFCVRDTGVGIPPDRLNAIFERFTQADGATTRRYGGTGLGLTISKRIVELLGGTIWVESAPGEGSAFFVRLEFVRGGQGETSRTTMSTTTSSPATPALNVEEALERLTGDRELLLMAVESFVESLPVAVERIRDAIENGLIETVCNAAHGLKGAASTIGADSVGQVARDLEEMARRGDCRFLHESLERLVHEASRLKVEARRFAAGSGVDR